MMSQRSRMQKKFTTVYLSLRMLQAGVLIVYLVGSLVLTGGQVAANGSPIWGEVLTFPLFSPPGWVMLAVSILGALLAVPVAVLARLADSGRLNGAFSATAAGTAASFFFAWSQPATAGASMRWQAAFVDVAVLAILLVLAGVMAYLADRRRAQQGLPLWTGMDADDEHS